MRSSTTVWEIPGPLAVQEISVDNKTSIVVRRHGNPEGPRVVVSHGNGLSTDLYYPFWRLLVDDFDVIVFDLRNHGWNAIGSIKCHHVPAFSRDIDLVMEGIDHHFGHKPSIGIFHSISALATLISPLNGENFAARILFDPPACKADEFPVEFDTFTRTFSFLTRQLPEVFQSIEQVRKYLSFMPITKNVDSEVFELYAHTVLRKQKNKGSYARRCPRDYEAQVIDLTRLFAVIVDFDAISCPTKIIGPDPALPYAYVPSYNLNSFVTIDYEYIPQTSHFMQFEKPEHCVQITKNFLKKNRLI